MASSLNSKKPATAIKSFKPEDYSRFLIREFLKKNGFNKTYEKFLEEDTREKVTMTKNELTRLLGIDSLMKRNAKSKVFNTMLDIVCDFLVISKEYSNGLGVQYPRMTTSSIHITQSKTDTPAEGEQADFIKNQPERPPVAVYGNVPRPMTSGGPPGVAKTQANFFNPTLQSKPTPLLNAFSAGSNAELSVHNEFEMETEVLNKQSSKPNFSNKNNLIVGQTSGDIYGTTASTAVGGPIKTNEPSMSGIGGSIKQSSSKMQPGGFLLN